MQLSSPCCHDALLVSLSVHGVSMGVGSDSVHPTLSQELKLPDSKHLTNAEDFAAYNDEKVGDIY
jgi:hypothetical protein